MDGKRKQSERSQERAWRRRRQIVIALETVDHIWDKPELDILREAWNEGKPIKEMAVQFKRNKDEILIGLMELRRQKKIRFVDIGEIKKEIHK